MSGYFEIYRGVVNSWECDIMGHMNVQFYTGKASEGMAHFRAACGMTPGYIARTGHSMAAVQSLARYVGELHAGDTLHIEAAVTGVGEKTVDLVADIVNSETGRLSCGFDLTCVSFDLNTRSAMPWPADIRQRLEDMRTARRDAPRPPSTGGPGAPAPAGGYIAPFVSCRGSVNSWECDELGHMGARFYMTRAADAIGHVKNRIGMSRTRAQENGWGSAALEYTIQFRRELRAGNSYSMYSGLLDVARKTFRFGHALVNDDNGDICATFDAVGCMFDMQTRKSIEIPDYVRDEASRWIIEWPMPERPAREAAE
jgi:acyl-CoA thioester hydrolase